MKEFITVNPDGELPIYMQIVTGIQGAIHTGRLEPDTRLPTVRDLADRLGVSRGTVKHAYDELEQMGAIQMVQGRGSFVLGGGEEELSSKKERGMRAIDRMLDELDRLGFATRDIQIFLDLKLREREDRHELARIAVLDCNPEALATFADQLAALEHTEVLRYLLADVMRSPARLGEDLDLIVTSSTHYGELAGIIPLSERVVQCALSPTTGTVAELARLDPGGKLGSLTVSEKFASIIQNSLRELHGGDAALRRAFFGRERELGRWLRGLDAVVVPSEYLRLCSEREFAALERFTERGGTLIRFAYRIDAGSFLHVQQRVGEILAQKRARAQG